VLRVEQCTREVPRLQPVIPGRQVACLRADDDPDIVPRARAAAVPT
jgi:hypothetical protein